MIRGEPLKERNPSRTTHITERRLQRKQGSLALPVHLRAAHADEQRRDAALEGLFDLEFVRTRAQARTGDLVRMPRGIPHAHHNNQTMPARALFWVTPARRLRALFDQLHEHQDLEVVVRLSCEHEVDFLPSD